MQIQKGGTCKILSCMLAVSPLMFAAPSGVAWYMWTQESWGGGPLSRHGWTANFLPKSQMLPRCVCTFCEFHPKMSFWYLILLSLLQPTSFFPLSLSLSHSFSSPPYVAIHARSVWQLYWSRTEVHQETGNSGHGNGEQLHISSTHEKYECILCCECKLSNQSFTRVLLQITNLLGAILVPAPMSCVAMHGSTWVIFALTVALHCHSWLS